MVECNRGCGSTDLHWKIVNGKYKLFSYNDLLHICNDGKISDKSTREKATAKILNELGILEPAMIPKADCIKTEDDKVALKEKQLYAVNTIGDPKKMFTINTTANGIAITGDDKHNAIYLPKIAVPELVKALMDFIL
jgi:hypothetical protein